MGNREVDGFQVWAEVSQQGAELAGTFVLTRAIDCKVGTKRFRVITVHTFRPWRPRKQHQSRSYKRSHQFPRLVCRAHSFTEWAVCPHHWI